MSGFTLIVFICVMFSYRLKVSVVEFTVNVDMIKILYINL